MGYLGREFQVRLLNHILVDHHFANSILDILSPSYFDDEYLRIIAGTILNIWEEQEFVPDYANIEFNLIQQIKSEQIIEMVRMAFDEVKNASLVGDSNIKKLAMWFCKQQDLKSTVNKIQKIIDSGDIERYPECEELIRKSLETGDNKDDAIDVFNNLDDVLADDFRKPTPTGIHALDIYMDGGLAPTELGVILAPFGVGKAQPLTSKILTPNGWTTMGKIKVGDYVIGKDGKPTKVVGVYPQGIRPIYEVKFNDKTKTLCDKEHLWAVNSINQRNRSTRKNGKIIKLEPDHTFKTVKTVDMINNVRVWNNRRLNYKIPNLSPVEFEKKDLLVNPYLLGLILGDGCITEGNQPHFVTKDMFLIDEAKKYHNKISVIELIRKIKDSKTAKLVERKLFKVSLLGFKDDLIKLNLFGCNSESKFIPNDYLYSTVEDRVNLLQGLVDTDGNVNKHRIEITTVSKIMANQIRELVMSLGGTCNISEKIGSYKKNGVKIFCKKVYRVYFSFPDSITFNPCRLSRKLSQFKFRDKYANNKFISSIKYSHEEEAQCIMVENPEHLYVTDDYILTHNTTLITKIANSAKNAGLNVVQIFFEDNPKVIQRKHLTCWHNSLIDLEPISINDLKNHKDTIKRIADEEKIKPGKIKLKKFPSDGTTIPKVKQYLRKLIASGFRVDMVLLDYIDCIQPSKQYNDQNVAEGAIMRQFETMLNELNLIGWAAVQGNRQSINAQVVDSTMMGGSIKRGQIGHFVLSIAKTLPQKENGTANLAILKSRFGQDGIIFEDCIFDNSRLIVDITQNGSGKTFTETKKAKEKLEAERINEVLAKRNKLQEIMKKEGFNQVEELKK